MEKTVAINRKAIVQGAFPLLTLLGLALWAWS